MRKKIFTTISLLLGILLLVSTVPVMAKSRGSRIRVRSHSSSRKITSSKSNNNKSTSSKTTSNGSTSVSSGTKKAKSTKIDTSSKALKNLPSNVSANSVSNNYYYSDTKNKTKNLLSNFWIYRRLTPHNRHYINNYGVSYYAPAYTGIRSVLYDIVAIVLFVGLGGIFIILNRTKKQYIETRIDDIKEE